MNDFENNNVNNDQPAENRPEQTANQYRPQTYSQPVYTQPTYSQPQYQYRPEQNVYQQYQNPQYGNYYQQAAPAQKQKKGTSKGFVIGMVAIGIVISILSGALFSAILFSRVNKGTTPSGNGSIVINHSGEDRPVVTDKGDAAYAASVALDTVVEINTETETHSPVFGQYVTEGAGSGVIISSTADGGTYIITCAHVIEGATTVTVRLTDGSEYKATALAYDTMTDVGYVKIDVGGLKTAPVGDFSKVVVGERVIAIGNPLGELGGSVSDGIISALEREILIEGLKYDLLQTNAAINPGNSGGGLFDMSGNLIGIVNAKSSGSGIEGLGFSIPINGAMEVFEELVKNGYVSGRVKIGVTLREITQDNYLNYIQYRRYITDYGVYIEEAENDQLKQWDRIVSIDSVEISTVADIRQLLLDYKVGDTVKIQVARIGKTGRAELVTVEVVLTEMKNN